MNKKVDLEIVIPDLNNCEILNDLEKTKELVKVLEYIDQPINSRFSSLLQICCQYAKDVAVISYLLEHGANPNYLDIDCHDAIYYACRNKDKILRQLCIDTLIPYVQKFIKPDKEMRKKQAFDLIKAEIQRHNEDIEESQRLLDELIAKCYELEVSDGK